ncbi:MAG TPA: aromatic amino acid lyase, partial [Chitinophagaceae bacterium]|nr:aromatic amino acid lyase [Chitinophagaceae bacterium]
MADTFYYGTDTLTIQKTIALANKSLRGVLGKDALEKVNASRRHVAEIVASKKTVYGINTGFGILANTSISEADTRTLQHKILQSHSVGVGDPIPVEVAKIMLITKVHALAQGFSGVQPETLHR